MKVTLMTNDEQCADLIQFKCTHITMFEGNKLQIHFLTACEKDMLDFIRICIKYYVLIQIQGATITIIPESNNYQRVRFRFDK